MFKKMNKAYRSIVKKKELILFYFFGYMNDLFNRTMKLQSEDFKSIPILIISFNQLSSLKRLIHFLQENSYKNIVIIDNASTYAPLLSYYSELEGSVEVIYNERNDGQRVFWKNSGKYKRFGKGYYVITDADIEPIKECPEDFLNSFRKKLERNRTILKVGFSLKIDDIPERNINKSKVLDWEQRFWKRIDKEGDYMAPIDTTFALYRPLNQYFLWNHYAAIRMKKPFIAKHWGWYINSDMLTEEQKYYIKTATFAGSWRVDAKGNLIEDHY